MTVYVPKGYDIVKIIQHLAEEQGTATNIKSTQTRNNVIDALERMIQHLRLFKKTPDNGLAVFSGNIASKEGKSDVRVWSIEPPIPINTRIYRCDKNFQLSILEGILEIKETYGMASGKSALTLTAIPDTGSDTSYLHFRTERALVLSSLLYFDLCGLVLHRTSISYAIPLYRTQTLFLVGHLWHLIEAI